MSVQQSSFSDKTDPVAMGEGIAEQAAALELAVREAVQQGHSLDTLERRVFDAVLRIGHAALELFFSQQGNGDLGESVTTSDGRTLDRSEQPAPREVRTVFGRHTFECDCSSGAGLDVARNGWFSAGSYDTATEVLPIGTHRQLP